MEEHTLKLNHLNVLLFTCLSPHPLLPSTRGNILKDSFNLLWTLGGDLWSVVLGLSHCVSPSGTLCSGFGQGKRKKPNSLTQENNIWQELGNNNPFVARLLVCRVGGSDGTSLNAFSYKFSAVCLFLRVANNYPISKATKYHSLQNRESSVYKSHIALVRAHLCSSFSTDNGLICHSLPLT